jgi:hypothetical protein
LKESGSDDGWTLGVHSVVLTKDIPTIIGKNRYICTTDPIVSRDLAKELGTQLD